MEHNNPYTNFGGQPAEPPPLPPHYQQPANPVSVRTWLILLHLSALAGYVIPYAGFVAPLVVWMTMKNESPVIDAHGRVVANWVLSLLIYWAVVFALFFVMIGILLAPLLLTVNLVFSIVGAIKASNGVLWKYPLSIPFF